MSNAIMSSIGIFFIGGPEICLMSPFHLNFSFYFFFLEKEGFKDDFINEAVPVIF